MSYNAKNRMKERVRRLSRRYPICNLMLLIVDGFIMGTICKPIIMWVSCIFKKVHYVLSVGTYDHYGHETVSAKFEWGQIVDKIHSISDMSAFGNFMMERGTWFRILILLFMVWLVAQIVIRVIACLVSITNECANYKESRKRRTKAQKQESVHSAGKHC